MFTRRGERYLERCSVFGRELPTPEEGVSEPAEGDSAPIDLKTPFLQARDRLVASFEHRYLDTLLLTWKVGEAAAAAGIDGLFFWRLLRYHGVRNPAK